MEKRVKTLHRLRPGESAVIEEVRGEPALRRRLAELGLTPGCRVTMRRVAPLGDPVLVFLRGYELSLRQREAGRIVLRWEE